MSMHPLLFSADAPGRFLKRLIFLTHRLPPPFWRHAVVLTRPANGSNNPYNQIYLSLGEQKVANFT
jgi:hypothetical protein